MQAVVGNPFQLMEAQQERGAMLAESKWSKLVDGLDGMDATNMARILENTHQWMAGLDETVRAINVGNFDRFAFPLVRAVYPQLAAQDIVSVQPMDGPVGQIFYFSITYGSKKGRIQSGTELFSPLSGHPGDDFFSSPEIQEETVGTGDGSTQQFTTTLDYTPVLPGTFKLSDGQLEVTDNGKGKLVGDVDPAGNNTIVYTTGAVDVTFAVAPASGVSVTADYEYDNEANQNIPEVDFHITSSPVVAKAFKLRTQYSLEAAQNAKSLHGLSIESELVVALAQAIRFEIDRTIIKELHAFAEATPVAWPLSPQGGVTFTEHKLSFVDILIRGSNNIFELTRRGLANWVVTGLEGSNVIESLPGFNPSDQLSTPNGVIYAGDLQGRWRIYKDPYNIDGTAGQRNFLLGYKGDTFLDAGFVYSPYIPFYTTPTVVLDDFLGRKGLGTLWGRKKVNGRFYCPGTLTGSFSP